MKALFALSLLSFAPQARVVERTPTEAVYQSVIFTDLGVTVVVQGGSPARAEWAAGVCRAALQVAGTQDQITTRSVTGTFYNVQPTTLYDLTIEYSEKQ